MELKTLEISFCDKKAENLVNSETKKYIIDSLKSNFNVSITDKYALILNEKNIKYLSLNPHLITLKTSGSNYFLYLTKLNGINSCLFIDRKIKQGYTYPRIICVKYRFHDDLYNNTLFDGELVKDKENNWMFLINKLILYKGEIIKCNYITNINKIYNLLTNYYTKDNNLDICPLLVKKVFTYNEYDDFLTKFMPNLKYGIRGIYFNTLNTKHANYLFLINNNSNSNRDQRPKKKLQSTNKYNSKPEITSTNLVVFELQKTAQPEIYDLYCINNNTLHKYNIACVPTMRSSKKIQSFFGDGKDKILVECKYVEKFNKYEPINVIKNKPIVSFDSLPSIS